MQKQVFYFLWIPIVLSALASQAQNATDSESLLNLKQCVDVAIQNNLLVEQSAIAMQTSKVAFNQAIGNALPNINAQAQQQAGFGRVLNTYTYTYLNQELNSGAYGLNGNLLLFQGFQVLNTIKQNQLAYSASKLDVQQQKENITLTVILDYLAVLAARDLVTISREQADVDLRQVNRLQLQSDAGSLLLLSDLSNLKGSYAGDLVSIAAADNALETAKINLFQVMNVPYKKNIQCQDIVLDLQSSDTSTSSETIYQTALQTLPEIKSVDLKIKAFQKGLSAARGQYYPQLSLYASVNTSFSNAATTSIPGSITDVVTTDYVTVGGTNYNVVTKQQNFTTQYLSFGDQFRDNKYTSVGLSLYVPIVNFLRARNNVKQAKVNLLNAQYNANSTRLVLQQGVEQAFQNMIAAYKQYKSYQDQVEAYAESFRTTEIRFNEGVINSDPYVIAKNNIDRARINLSQAKYIYILRTKILDYYQGRLTL
jgi:outer membrane protein